MDCKETQRCIALFLKDELDNDTAFSFAEHVYACKECMEELTIEYLLVEGTVSYTHLTLPTIGG